MGGGLEKVWKIDHKTRWLFGFLEFERNVFMEIEIVVLTLSSPAEPGLKPLGVVNVVGKWNLPLANAIPELADKLKEEAKKRFPTCVRVYNMKWYPGVGHYGHFWHEATGDAYEVAGILESNQ